METPDAADTKFKKGQKSGPGRPKGTPNKVSADIKNMVLTALNSAGGAEYLERCANDPKTATAFLGLVGKVLPMQVQGAGANGEHVTKVLIEFVGTTP